jgi:ABC-type branched-subunit amino acid transport system ATPase component
LVEQLATRALALADRAYILEADRIVKTGSAPDRARDPEVTAAYLWVNAPVPRPVSEACSHS